ncbi:hypothetical protein [uncultured Xanthomonas sp.]|uniref:hypothetical protein n=1 Tax=uncultured Xanthomonas sp. TaxID=152831 RepID=UPI003748BC7F
MKPSPLQLDAPEYTIVSVRAIPSIGQSVVDEPLPIVVRAQVMYDSDGSHFAMLSIDQSDDSRPYVISLQVLVTFRIDVDGCRQAYKSAFNPEVVAVNVARILYSGAREMLALVSSRAPYGTALLPSVMLEPSDVEMLFETDKLEDILQKSFGVDPSMMEAARAKAEAVESSRKKEARTLATKKPATKRKTEAN